MRYEIQEWSQDKAVYEGRHAVGEVIAVVTVEDLLNAMYTVNVELTDENLETVLMELNSMLIAEFHDDLECYVDKTAREWGLTRKELP